MESALTTAGLSTSSVVILALLYKGLVMMKGRRLISDCCGRKGEVGFDVRAMPSSPDVKAPDAVVP
jgi:hypothetical protein